MRNVCQHVPHPDDEPEAYARESVLEELYVRRGWSRRDIAEHFDVEVCKVREALRRHDITHEVEGSGPPTSGLARKLWENGLQKTRSAANGGVEHAD